MSELQSKLFWYIIKEYFWFPSNYKLSGNERLDGLLTGIYLLIVILFRAETYNRLTLPNPANILLLIVES